MHLTSETTEDSTIQNEPAASAAVIWTVFPILLAGKPPSGTREQI